ncbi:MAG: chorismate mutase [Bacteroidia bacterium]|nr:chorismate mutase [Bacteroidia bacterium]
MKSNFSKWINQSSKPFLIAGPCSAETHGQIMQTAQGIATYFPDAIFRAGVWKPRTRPGAFEGIGQEALLWLDDMRQQTGLRYAIEVATSEHVELALKHQVDVLWIGARTVVNPFSVQHLADALKGVTHIPILIKNPIHPDVNLWLGAIERIYNSGIENIAAVHRGFYKYGQTRYRNYPAWEIPVQLKTIMPDLPLFCDPSHIGGKRKLIAPVAQQAMDLAMDGLMIETHCNPEQAWSDASQQITPKELLKLINGLNIANSEADEPNGELNILRKSIDIIDDELLSLLNRRNALSHKIGEYKVKNNITILQIRRRKNTLKNQLKQAKTLNLNNDFIKAIYQTIHDESIRIQSEIKKSKSTKKKL